MQSYSTGLSYRERVIGSLAVPTLEFLSSSSVSLEVRVRGTIVNSITERAGDLRGWKVKVANAVKRDRGGSHWLPSDQYTVSLGLRFCLALHGGRRLDVENFTKPILDATAAGLFMSDSQDAASIERWDFDDSNFNTLLIHRLPNTKNRNAEGVAIFISRR